MREAPVSFTNAFIGKPERPDDEELAEALGPAKALWDGLRADLSAKLGIDSTEWKCYSPKTGWTLRLYHKKRVLVYLSPARGWFLASFALGDKAVRAALGTELPAPVLELIRGAKRYVEGTAVRIEVKRPKDVAVVTTIAPVKRDN